MVVLKINTLLYYYEKMHSMNSSVIICHYYFPFAA
jgi:hypothetical protein